MKNIKILFISFALIFSFNFNNVFAQCDYSDDFITLPPATVTHYNAGYETTGTTVAGWAVANIQVVTGGTQSKTARNSQSLIGTGKQGVTLGTANQPLGSVTSPEYTNGCDSISFKYSKRNTSTVSRNIKIEIIQNDVVILTCDTTISCPDVSVVYTFGKKTSISGSFKLKITKNASTESDITLWDICITAAVAVSPDAPSASISGIVKAEGNFWDKANVTLNHRRSDVDIYYTTDGTAPTAESTLYTAPFSVTQTTPLKAIAVAEELSSDVLDTLITVTASPYKITAPDNATVFVGVPTGSGYNYRPFTAKTATYTTAEDGKTTYYYNVSGKHNYRVSRADAVTTVGVFTPSATATALEITEAQLTSHSPKEIDHDVNNLLGRNVADIFVNINAAGHLHLSKVDTTFQIVNQRNWQTIDNDVNNYFFQPDFHYTVLDENFAPSNAVITVSPSGLITPVGEGTAIVLITYDALLCTHTTNVGNNGNAFFSALWPENTGVFAVTVGEKGAAITSNMTVSEYWNSDGTDKTSGIALDSEHDVLYYEAAKGGFDYTFKPAGVLDVTLAQPTVGTNALSFSNFSQNGVRKNADGSYTLHLTEGRNIVQLISSDNYKSDFQVITAKPVTWTISNVTRPGETPDKGDKISVLFNTLYHPANKMAGIYNMSAGIQYSIQATNFPLILGANQYTFASRAQTYEYTIPTDYAGDDITLTNGVIKTTGYGSVFGSHRFISLVNGVMPNLNASVRESYLGSIPNIHIHTVGIPPTVPGNLQTLGITETSITLKWVASTDNVGVEGYIIWVNGDSLTTVSKSTLAYPVGNLTPATEYTFEVAAFDASGNRSEKAAKTETTLTIEYNYTITVPEGANVYVGSKGSTHYVPFTEKAAVYTSTNEGKTTFYYNVSGQHNYRVSKAGALTQAGLFTPGTSSTGLEITNEQLYSNSPKETDHDVSSNGGYNVADIFLNINEKGHLKLSSGNTCQLVNLRNWQLTNSTTGNYFIEPDFHYTVVNESGAEDNSVVTISPSGIITAQHAGTAIVLVTYDAIRVESAMGGKMWSALWPENTGVFVVSVDAPQSNIISNMLINETWNPNNSAKVAATAVDAELDVFYYLAEAGGYDYTFTPANVTSVALAQPLVGAQAISYNGFSTEGVTHNGDGSYTVHLVSGRNIVKLTSAAGTEYQVLTAKPLTYTLTNATHVNEDIKPGDKVSIRFNTLYHPCNKLSGVYNMSASIQYSANGSLVTGTGNQYAFAYAANAQTVSVTIPASYTENSFRLTGGVLKASGFGDPYGGHRDITLAAGKNPNFTALQRIAYFGALPDITISGLQAPPTSTPSVDGNKIAVYPNPFADYIIIHATADGTASIYDVSGKQVLTETIKAGENRINTSGLQKGVYLLKQGLNAVKMVK